MTTVKSDEPRQFTSDHSFDGYSRDMQYGLIEIYGKDAERFLHSQTTSDVKALPAMHAQMSALLDRKAHVKAYFSLYRKHDSFRILASRVQIADILEHLDNFRFADKVEFLDLSDSGKFIALFGLHSRKLLLQMTTKPHNPAMFENDLIDATIADHHVHIFRVPLAAEEVFMLWVKNDDWESFGKKLATAAGAMGLRELTAAEIKELRIEAGLPLYGIDFDDSNLIIELGLEDRAISYTKGCYQGQEVLARVKANGTPAKQLTGLTFMAPGKDGNKEELHEEFPLGSKLIVGGQEVATIYSNSYCRRLHGVVALAFVKKEKRIVDTILDGTVNGKAVRAKVTILPFVTGHDVQKRAHSLYEQALQLFARNQDSQNQADGDGQKAVELLKEAIVLDPSFEDAYETLGVILSKQNEIDEAIEWMQKLARLNPDSVMAHANLSVFWLEKGDKEKAEEEKAESMSIRMRMAAREAAKNKKEQEDEGKLAAETKERLSMFSQVLEIDADDMLANYGAGSCYVLLKDYGRAIEYLEKAIAIKSTHTMAYLELGKAFEGIGDKAKAADTYTKGIAVASQKGDMTPLKEMQTRFGAL